MSKPNMSIPKSMRKHIRKEKARIRKSVAGLEERKKLIEKMYEPYRHEDK